MSEKVRFYLLMALLIASIVLLWYADHLSSQVSLT
jgi:hypothetical protein